VRALYLFLLLCTVCLNGLGQSSPSPTPAQPQNKKETDQEETIRITTTLVGVPVTVLDRQGRLIPDLKQSDFHVYEDGVEQEIAYFAPVEAPVTVLLLSDQGLFPKHLVKNFQETALAFADQLRPGDKVIAAKFGDTKFEVLTKTDAAVQKGPHQIKWRFGTALHDAVDSAIRYMNGLRGRKAIVLFSNGLVPRVEVVTMVMSSGQVVSDTVTKAPERTTPRQTLNEAEESDAPIYVMYYDTMNDAVRFGPKPGTRDWQFRESLARLRNDYVEGAQYLRALAEKSGARLFPANKPPGLDEAFTQIRNELRQQYSLGYYPKKPGQPNDRREIRVRVTRPDVVVRARTTYVYAAPKP
jgi:Ca-activated chloride channel homolog